MKRREFITAAPALLVASSSLLTTGESEAFLPFLLRLLVGGVVRGTVTRAVTTTVTRTVTRQMVATASLGLRASGLLAVSSGVALAYEKHQASEIWVAGQAEQTVSISTEEGVVSKREQVYLGYRVVDVESGRVEKIGLKNVSINPEKPISLSHLVKNLPNTGAKFVEGLASFDSKGQQVNSRFSFTERKTIIVASADEVKSS